MEDQVAADIFAALGHPTRVRLLRLLLEAGDQGAAAGALAEAISIAPSSLSHHLASLEHQGLITHQRHQRSLIYRADEEKLRGLIAFLVNDCCEGDPVRCGFAFEPSVARPC